MLDGPKYDSISRQTLIQNSAESFDKVEQKKPLYDLQLLQT